MKELEEKIVRDNAKLFVVGIPQDFSRVNLDVLDPDKTYILAILEAK